MENTLKRPRGRPPKAAPLPEPLEGTPDIRQTLDDTKGSIETPKVYVEPLAAMTLARYQNARRHRSMQKLDDSTVDEVLQRCWRQVEGEPDPCMMELIEETGVDLNINISLLKVEAFESWARSVIVDSLDMPWTVEPTTIPELSYLAKEEVLGKLRKKIFAEGAIEGGTEDLPSLVRRMKAEQLALEQTNAAQAAANMERLMKDQSEEGGFRDAMLMILRDFATYPYCVLAGPVPVVDEVLEWKRDGLKTVRKLVMRAKRYSPFDLWWSADSPDTQRGSFVILRDKMTRPQLTVAAMAKSYIGKNVIAAMDHFSKMSTPVDWMNPNPERNNSVMWGREDEIDVMTMYGKFSARELRPYGLQVDDGTFYEACVKTLGPYCIAVRVNRNPHVHARPVYTAAMSKGADKIPGKGIAQKVRDIERGYHAALRGMVRNTHYSAGPIGEVDYSRISRWINDDQIGSIDPFTVQPVDPDITGGGRAAHYFHTVPSIAGQAIQIMQYFEHLADRHTQIPAAFHGEAVGTGVNRTFRGVTLLQGNALKGVQAALTNLGQGAITPYATNLFFHNMLYAEDDRVKGDCKPLVRDIAGLLEREVKKQQTLETLQVVAQVAQAGEAPPGALAWAASEALKAAGIPIERFAEAEARGTVPGGSQQPQTPQQQLAGGGGAPATPNPQGTPSQPDFG